MQVVHELQFTYDCAELLEFNLSFRDIDCLVRKVMQRETIPQPPRLPLAFSSLFHVWKPPQKISHVLKHSCFEVLKPEGVM